MTILPSKPKKNMCKGERHPTAQSTNRTPAVSHAHHHNVCASALTENRKPAPSQSSKGNVSKAGGVHSGGAVSTDCSKKQPFRREGGRNSDDEYGEGFADNNLESLFEERLYQDRGLHIKAVRGDGACLFRAVADQVYGDEEMHSDVRRLCLDYMEKNRDHFSQFVTEDFDEYLARKRREDEHGNHVELQAISEIFSRPIEIYEYATEPKNIFSPRGEPSSSLQPNAPIRLSYHGTVHYNSVFDPKAATIGVGLGLPGYAPGSADVSLMRDALLHSEMHLIEEAMLNDKINMTDYERTEQEISNQVARESYLEYVRNIETASERKAVSGVKRPTSVVDSEPGCSRSPLPKMRSREHSQDTKGETQMKETEAKGTLSFYEELLASSVSGGGEWGTAVDTDADENALLAQVMALSQHEFLDSLTQRHSTKDSAHTEDAAEKAGSSKSSA